MNTPKVTRLPDGRLRLTIVSEGERDQSVVLTEDELAVLVASAEHEHDDPKIGL